MIYTCYFTKFKTNFVVQVEWAKITDQLPRFIKTEDFVIFKNEIYPMIAKFK